MNDKAKYLMTNVLKDGDTSDTVFLDNLLHADFPIIKNGYMGTPEVTIIDRNIWKIIETELLEDFLKK